MKHKSLYSVKYNDSLTLSECERVERGALSSGCTLFPKQKGWNGCRSWTVEVEVTRLTLIPGLLVRVSLRRLLQTIKPEQFPVPAFADSQLSTMNANWR
jgi:hypothetical protein